MIFARKMLEFYIIIARKIFSPEFYGVTWGSPTPMRSKIPTGLCFTADVFFFMFSPRFLRDPSTDRPETLPHDRKLAELYKLTSKIRGALPPTNLGAENMRNFGQFWTTSDFDREYLRNEATYPKSERRTNEENSSCV